MAFTPPTVANFKTQFSRDFPYGTDPNNAVLDSDIILAFNYADTTFNPALWQSQTSYTIGYLLLAAHYLVLNLRASSQGLNGQYNWIQSSKSVGAVSETFEIPQRLKDNPDFMAYAKTHYGAQYLNLLWPLLAGNTFAIFHRTRA